MREEEKELGEGDGQKGEGREGQRMAPRVETIPLR